MIDKDRRTRTSVVGSIRVGEVGKGVGFVGDFFLLDDLGRRGETVGMNSRIRGNFPSNLVQIHSMVEENELVDRSTDRHDGPKCPLY